MSVNSKLPFEPNLNTVQKKVSHELNARGRVSNYISQLKLAIIMKAFITSQFLHYPLILMCQRRKLKNRINNLDGRVLKLIFKSRKSTFERLLIREKSVSVHSKYLQILVKEIYKVQHGTTPAIMNKFFNTKNSSSFETRNIKTVYDGPETIAYIGPKIWNLVLQKIKDSDNFNIFKSNIDLIKPENCFCCLFKLYLSQIRFL